MRDDHKIETHIDLAAASVALRLEGIGRRWRKEIESRLKRTGGLDIDEGWGPLLYIGCAGVPVHQRDVGEALGIEAHLLGSLLDQLEDRDLISRAYDPHDRRAKLVAATAVGLTKIRHIETVVDDVWNELLSDIPEKEIGSYLDILERIELGLARAPADSATLMRSGRRIGTRTALR